ncbi:MerR family transcriptional regulator [Extibacter muris]|uniref:MerR family transcriptional regulator n=1 Tax=Extibacter muris TaxID=1796622 RepID=UPI001D070444|nr:MerR family transcriptional regulator [Extibacter muris]MCB6200959.1 MerR family transcriptional regulator [Extibacter muris]MCQ4662289.1 MerR family transcriptional regulator [Extibacter muris]MCQ4691797.1 MerR family transcriptional regulator [Extibacter muris]
MSEKLKDNYICISDFAKLTGISRRNLLFYDEIGVLKPEYKNNKGYRYYSLPQMDTACLVVTLRELGVPLKDIVRYNEERSPDTMLDVFKLQKEEVYKKIHQLEATLVSLDKHIVTIERYKDIETDIIEVQEFETEPVYYSEPGYGDGSSTVERITRFYFECKAQNAEPGYSVGCSVSKEDLQKRVCDRPYRVYYKDPKASTFKNKGLYVTGYHRCHYGDSAPLYKKIFAFIEENCFQILGDSYEEHLLNELCIANSNDYLMRIQIPVISVTR